MHILINKVKFLIACLLSTLKFYSYANLLPRSKEQCTDENSNYIISLTSYHKRFSTLYLTLESLLHQSNRPKAIYVWLSSDDITKFGGKPKYLTRYEVRGVRVIILDENIRSYKKLSYIESILEDSMIEYVITADDDIMYPNYWTMKLLETSKLHNAVSCYRGHYLKYDGVNFNYTKNINIHFSDNSPSWKLMPTGCSGVCYPRSSISEFVSDKRFLELAFDADDIWYKGMSILNGFQSVRVEKINKHFPLIITSLNDTLYSKNVHESENEDKLIKTYSALKLLDYFK